MSIIDEVGHNVLVILMTAIAVMVILFILIWAFTKFIMPMIDIPALIIKIIFG